MQRCSATRNVLRGYELDPGSSAKRSHRTRCDITCGRFERGPVSLQGENDGARMQAYLDANPRGKHGAHRYRLEDYGLDAAELRRRLKFYTDRFDVALES